jgi:hypothetical protein
MNETSGWFSLVCPRCGSVCSREARQRVREADARDEGLEVVAQAAWEALHHHGVSGYGNWVRLSEAFADLLESGWTPKKTQP